MLTLPALCIIGWLAPIGNEPQETPKADQMLHGLVRGPDGKPAAGAIVRAVSISNRVEVVTDATGRYEMSLPPGVWSIPARKGTLGGEAVPSGNNVFFQSVRGGAPLTADIDLEERGNLRLRLVTDTGEPIAGAIVSFPDGSRLQTDAKGRVVAGGLVRGHQSASASAPGRMTTRILVDRTAQGEDEITVPMARCAGIEGQVLDPDGKPIANATLGTSRDSPRSNADGSFVINSTLPELTGSIRATAPGYRMFNLGSLPLDLERPLKVTIRLEPEAAMADQQRTFDVPTRTITGQVFSPDGKPHANALVCWGVIKADSRSVSARTGEDGKFALMVPNEDNYLGIFDRHFPPEFVKVDANVENVGIMHFQNGATVRGKVVDDDGQPLKGVLVAPTVPHPRPRAGMRVRTTSFTYTDEHGDFVVTGVPENAMFDFDGRGLITARDLTLDHRNENNRIKLHYHGAIKGRVVDEHGQPVRNFRILMDIPRNIVPGDSITRDDMALSVIGVHFASHDGSFLFSRLNPGSVYCVTALAPGHCAGFTDRVAALPMNKLDASEAVVIKLQPTRKLNVRVTGRGAPLPGAEVAIVNRSMVNRTGNGWDLVVRMTTNDQGMAQFSGLTLCSGHIFVRAAGMGRHVIEWYKDEDEFDVDLQPEAVFTGTINLKNAKGAKQFVVEMTGQRGINNFSASALINPEDNGRFTIGQLAQGTWNVRVKAPYHDLPVHTATVVLPSGQTIEHNIED